MLKCVCDMVTTYSQMHCTDKYSQHSSIILPVWVNGWVFVYKLSGSGFESHCCHSSLFVIKLITWISIFKHNFVFFYIYQKIYLGRFNKWYLLIFSFLSDIHHSRTLYHFFFFFILALSVVLNWYSDNIKCCLESFIS